MDAVASPRAPRRSSAAPAGAHIPALDGVRGIAILLVILVHYNIVTQPRGALEWISHTVALAGWSGVDLFFVLSGFLITGILYRSRETERYFLNFYARRALRIFPLYYGMLVVLYLLLPRLMPGSEVVRYVASDQAWYWSYLANVRIALAGFPDPNFVGHFWSLAVEEQFYLVWPLVVFLLPRRRLVTLCVAMVAGALLIRVGLQAMGMPGFAYLLGPARMDGLAAGALIALLAHEPGGVARMRRWAVPVGTAACAALALLVAWRRGLSADDPVAQAIGCSLLVLAFGAFLVLAIDARPGGTLGRVLSHPALAGLGRYSYAVYVFHVPINTVLRHTFHLPDRLVAFTGSLLAAQALYFAVGIILPSAAALLSWYLFERHFLKLKDRFVPARAARPAPAVAAGELTPVS